jgi:hypothetical protein
MGASPSIETINAAIRRNLKKHQNTLAGKGVQSTYLHRQLTGEGGNARFIVSYHISRASNGEVAIWPVFSIYNKATKRTETIGNEGDERVWTALDRGITRITELYREVPSV